MPGSRKTFADVQVDLGRYELRRFGRRIKLEKKPMELLIFLLGRREQMVSREEIIRKLWRSDLFIDTQKNLNNIVRKLRTALGDNVDRPRFLETVVGKGYRFVGAVKVIDAKYSGSDPLRNLGHTGSREDVINSGERSFIAVLPLLLLGTASDDQGLCLGFADALVSRLGNLPGLNVLPIATVLNLPLETTPSQAASLLGVRFVVHGAIQMSKGQWRLSVEMFDSYLQRSCFTKRCDLDLNRLSNVECDIAKQISGALNRPALPAMIEQRQRYSRDPLAYAEYVRGYRITASGDASMMGQASEHLTNAVTRDPTFALAHATLSLACTTRHFEFDPASVWLEKAEFHCRRALEIDSKNFQHLEAIADLKRALALQKNLSHAYNRLGTILAHIGLLDHAREIFEMGRPFQPKKAVSPSIVQVYVWSQEYELARQQIRIWRAESPSNKYALYFAPVPAMMTGDWKEASRLMDEALQLVPNEPLIVSLQGLLHALMGNAEAATESVTRACSNPKSFGHAHHTYHQIACILALTGKRETAFEWLERSVGTGFACWPYFLNDPCLASLRGLPEFEHLITAVQAKYPDHLGLL
jgi:DNA-binding winged helix-turn-helix (wHTH) protein/tetratricopeptide (TPR) repeat protein